MIKNNDYKNKLPQEKNSRLGYSSFLAFLVRVLLETEHVPLCKVLERLRLVYSQMTP